MIHATMPRTLEEYVQQIGRAGRNGQRADCILLLDDDAFLKIQSLARTAYAEAEAVEGFLGKVG